MEKNLSVKTDTKESEGGREMKKKHREGDDEIKKKTQVFGHENLIVYRSEKERKSLGPNVYGCTVTYYVFDVCFFLSVFSFILYYFFTFC